MVTGDLVAAAKLFLGSDVKGKLPKQIIVPSESVGSDLNKWPTSGLGEEAAKDRDGRKAD